MSEKPVILPVNYSFLQGGGEMGQIVRNFDWSQTSIGPPDQWPVTLRVMVKTILSSKFPMLVMWGEDLVQFYNDAFRPSLGSEGKHPFALGQQAKDCWAEIWDIISPLFDQILTTGEAIWSEDQLVPFYRNGRVEDIYWTFGYSAIYDETDRVAGILVVCTETTKKVLFQQKLKQSQSHLHHMILQAPVAMCLLNGPDHIIEIANERIIELWGKPPEVVMGKPVFEALPDAKGQGLEEVMKAVYDTGETFYGDELPVSLIRHGRREIVYQNFVYQAYRNQDGRITGVIAITLDVTEQVLARKKVEQSEAALLESQKKLEAELQLSHEIQRHKDDFIGMASHELKTPLTSLAAIVQFAGRKLEKAEDKFLRDSMEKAQLQVKRMTRMINGFLNVSRLESGKIFLEKRFFELNTLLLEIVAEVQLSASGHEFYIKDFDTIIVSADVDKISSVVTNLLSNAVKYAPKGKRIEVTCKKVNGKAIVSVKDEGMGMKAADVEQIFNRYYRVKSEHTQHISGFGIGLYLSAEIISLHNGRIWAESSLGVGSTFSFELPL